MSPCNGCFNENKTCLGLFAYILCYESGSLYGIYDFFTFHFCKPDVPGKFGARLRMLRNWGENHVQNAINRALILNGFPR